MTTEATIILPVHNGERQLRTAVFGILELAEAVCRRLRIVVVDDGSTDHTYEIACELARMFPQVTVLRQPFQRGLGPALDQVRRRVAVNQVIVHDGVSPIDVDELASLLENEDAAAPTADTLESNGSRRFAAVASLHARMSHAHRRTASLHWLRLEPPVAPRRKRLDPLEAAGDLFPALALGPPTPGTNRPTMTL